VDAVSVDGARRTEILETAARLFASSGLRTSLKEIADACGILPGSLYHHFASKEAIIVELIERYRAELDEIANEALRQLEELPEPGPEPISERIVALSSAIADCAVRHRAAVLLTFYEPPSGASDQLVRVARRTPLAVEKAMLETLRLGRSSGYIRPGIDLETLADRFCTTSLAVFPGVPGADRLPAIRCRILLEGVATRAPTDDELDRSAAFRAAQHVIDSWERAEGEEDKRLTKLRAVARAEFGRKGYEATTVRDIAAAAGLPTGTVYRLIGSKDELLTSIMRAFETPVRSGWKSVLESPSSPVEKVDALMWVNINVTERFNDEYNIELAWLRESPPKSANLGRTFMARLRDVKALLAEGRRSGEIHVEAPTSDIRAWALFDAVWTDVPIVRKVGARGALQLARDSALRGAARRP
jgi:AcrR family transcriptional regulator